MFPDNFRVSKMFRKYNSCVQQCEGSVKIAVKEAVLVINQIINHYLDQVLYEGGRHFYI